MKVAIIGASGVTGTELIKEALTRGHEVIGVARTPENIKSADPRIAKRKGDAFDRQSMIDGVAGADAVVTTIGKRDLRDTRYTLNTEGHRNIVEGMRVHNIKRLVPISSLGAAQVKRPGIRRNVYLFLRRKYYGDMHQMENEVLDSGLDVTVVRAPMLHNKEQKKAYEVIEGRNVLPSGTSVSRADLASCVFDELETDQYVHKVISLADFPES